MHYHVLSHARSVGLAGLLAIAVAGAANAQKKYDPGATDTEIKIGNIMPYSGTGVGLRHDQQDRGGLFQQDQCRRQHQRPQDQFYQLRRRLQPAEGGRARANWSRPTKCY